MLRRKMSNIDSRSAVEARATDPAESAAAGRMAQWTSLGLFVVCAAGRIAGYLLAKDAEHWAWLDPLLILLALATTLIGQAQRLPLQNVLAGTAIILVLTGGVEALAVTTGIPYGAVRFTEKSGPLILGVVPWLIPIVWVVVIFNARGVARLVFRPWRKTRNYGIWIITLTCLLAVVFDLGFDPLGHIGGYWLWEHARAGLNWHGTPLMSLVSWLLTALLLLAFTTPFLLNKKPQKSPPFYHPLMVWLTLSAVLAAGAAAYQLWWVAGLMGAASLLTLGFSVSGARW